jgi:hypothetical protein
MKFVPTTFACTPARRTGRADDACRASRARGSDPYRSDLRKRIFNFFRSTASDQADVRPCGDSTRPIGTILELA